MKIDTLVLIAVAAIAGIVAAGYFLALVTGVIVSGGLLLPVLLVFIAAIAIFVIVLRQRLASREDDYYDKIER